MNATVHASWQQNRSGALAMSGAMALIVVNDSMIKLASETVPAAQTIGVRGAFATLWIFLALLTGRQLRQLRHAAERRTLIRAGLDVVSTFSYLVALFHMPLAEATAINMAAPLIIVLLAVLVLREAVGWQRWAAVLTGFAGMLLVVRPGGASFTPWAAMCIGATVLSAARDIYTRSIPLRVHALVVTLATAAAVTLTGLAATLVHGWQPMTVREVALLVGASAFLASAYYLMIMAMRAGEASVIGGFRYSGLLAAGLLGWMVWGYVPDPVSLAGMTIVVGAGLALLRHERARPPTQEPA